LILFIKEPDTLSTVVAASADAHTQARPRLLYLIKWVELAERARLEEVLRPYGLTVPQYTALSSLLVREDLSSAQLARRSFVTPQAMNQVVATLERDGIIERRPDQRNRRILRTRLTDRGREILRSCDRAVDVLEEHMLSHLTFRQTEELRRALERCLEALSRSEW
jgi:DNA-binding MarR family transcriptional regulator